MQSSYPLQAYRECELTNCGPAVVKGEFDSHDPHDIRIRPGAKHGLHGTENYGRALDASGHGSS